MTGCFKYSLIVLILLVCLGLPASILGQSTSVHVSETVVKQRLSILNNQTPISLDYNESVQAYINVYTIKRKDHLATMLGRAELYFPLFEKYLDQYNLPLELKYLAIVESALDPKAKSSSGAMGLWQFLFNASRMFDLEVSTYVDERCDPLKSTIAACKYLDYLYRNFNDWQLALAAYNVGIGEVKKAMETSGKKTYWELKPFLPKQAQGYVPAFIAATYAFNNYSLYDINPTTPEFNYLDVDTVWIDKNISFEQIVKHLKIPIEKLAWLNPIYSKNYIPGLIKAMPLVLPVDKIAMYIRESNKMVSEKKPIDDLSLTTPTSNWIKTEHRVLPGEYFHKIAINYGCRVEDIMKWNNLISKGDLKAGQLLIIYKHPEKDKTFFIHSSIALDSNEYSFVIDIKQFSAANNNQ